MECFILISNSYIIYKSVYASSTFLRGNPLSTQPAAPRNVRPRRNDNIVSLPTPSSNLNHPISRGKLISIDRQQIARRNMFVSIRRGITPIMDRQQMERGNIVESLNEAIVDCTTPLINRLDFPISSNADELVNIVEEQTDLDLNLRL